MLAKVASGDAQCLEASDSCPNRKIISVIIEKKGERYIIMYNVRHKYIDWAVDACSVRK